MDERKGLIESTQRELPDESLAEVVGGVYVCQRVHVRGTVYYTSFGDPPTMEVDGYYYIGKIYDTRPCPVAIYYDDRGGFGSNFLTGWVKYSSIVG